VFSVVDIREYQSPREARLAARRVLSPAVRDIQLGGIYRSDRTINFRAGSSGTADGADFIFA